MRSRWMCALFLLALLGTTGCAEFFQELSAGLVGGIPTVSSPLLDQLGVRIVGDTMAVSGDNPLYCNLFVYGKFVGGLRPGGILYDVRHYEPLRPQVPMVAVCFPPGKEREPIVTEVAGFTVYKNPGCLGTAGEIFQIGEGNRSLLWRIRLEDIRRLDGERLTSWGWSQNYPAPKTDLKTQNAKFPREWWNATLGIPVIGSTYFTMFPRIEGMPLRNGAEELYLEPCDYTYLSLSMAAYAYGREVTLTAAFKDGDRYRGQINYRLWVPAEGLPAEIIAPSPFEIWPAN